MTDQYEQMRATPSDMRLFRFIARFARYALLPAAIVVVVAKIAGWLAWPWWLVVAPAVLYLLHPIVIGVLGPVMQYRRYRNRSGSS